MVAGDRAFRNTILREGAWTLAANIFSRIGGLVFTVILARYLLPEGFGLYSLALSISIIFITIADFGLNQTLVRYVSAYVDKNGKKAAGYFHYIYSLKLKIAFIVSAILLLLAYPLSRYIFRKEGLFLILIILSFYVFVAALQGFFDSLFYTKNKASKLTLKEFIFQSSRIVFVLSVFWLVGKGNYPLSATIGLLLASVLTLGVTMSIYRKVFDFKRDAFSKVDKKRVLTFAGFLMLSGLTGIILSYVDTIIMGFFLSLEYVGYYRASFGLIIALAGTLSFPGVFLSALTKVDQSKIQEAFDKIVRVLLLIIVPSVVGFVSLGKYFLVLIYGHEYLEGAILLYILAPFLFLFVISSLFLNLATAREKTKEVAYITLFSAVLNIVLNFIVINIFLKYSELAAAISVAVVTLGCWIVYFVLLANLLKSKINVRFRYKFAIKPLVSSAVMALFLYWYTASVGNMNLPKGLIEVVLGAAIYFFVMVVIGGLKKEDFYFLRDYLKSK